MTLNLLKSALDLYLLYHNPFCLFLTKKQAQLYTSLLLINCLIILISLVLLFYQREKVRSVLFLSLFLISVSCLTIVRTVIFFHESDWLVAALFNTFSPLYYLVGPFLFFHIRDYLTENQKFKKLDFLHFLPAFAQLINALPYLFSPFEQKLQLAEAIRLSPLVFQTLKVNLVFSFKISSLIPPVLVIFYAVFCLHRLFLKDPSKNQFKSSKAKKGRITTAWLIYLCIVISFVAVANIYFGYSLNFLSNHLFLRHIILIQTFFISTIPVSLIIFPQILYEITFNLRTQFPRHWHKKNKETVLSTDSNLEELSKRIHETMIKENNFLSNDYSLDQLVSQLDVPKYHVYQCLNERLKVKFSDLRSQYRIEYSKKLLADFAKQNITIEGIGINSGFPTRSSFYRAFKLQTGMTPIEFVRKSENESFNPK
jgi:AraC-like DNA-binding protein